MPLEPLGSGVLYEASTTGSGTGNYDSFLRLAANNNEEGFNTDDGGEADNKDGIWTHALLVGSMVVVNVGGVDYYEIRLDLNEIQSGDNPNITLEDLRIFRSTAPADGDDFDADFAGFGTEVFDLGAALNLVDTNHGSGTDDYTFYIPTSLFPSQSEYFTLYAKFSGSDDGFEEFRVKSQVFTPQPDIGVLKETNGTDDQCPVILVGEDVTWTYTVENNGNIALTNVVVRDDNGTPANLLDDFFPTLTSGDSNNNNILDVTETWIFTHVGTAQAGEYDNIATVSGAWTFGQTSGTVSSFEEDCYFGADPSIGIVKMTNGTDDLCPILSVGSTVTWTYYVTNSGNVALSNIVIMDDNGTPGANAPETDDDFSPTAVLSGGFNVGDLNTDGVFDPGEIWQYSATGIAAEGHYDNIATVAADFTDDFQNTATVTANEDDCYIGVEGPGVRTPGFWSNWGDFWDGDLSVPAQSVEDCFADYDLLRIDSNGDGAIDGNDSGWSTHNGQLGLFVGDYDRDGIAEAGEDVFFISLTHAQSLINASSKQMNDGVVKVGRDTVATWLNFLAGNSVGTVDGTDGLYSPREAIDDAVDYLQIFGDSSPSNANIPAEIFDVYSPGHAVIKSSSAFWSADFPGGGHSGAEIHSALDEYNNFGTIDNFGYAHDCDTEQFLATMDGFRSEGTLWAH